MKTGLFFFLGLLACAKGTLPTGNEPLLFSQLINYQSCTQDSECVYVQNGCCDCANGGEDAAVNQQFKSTIEDRFVCEGVSCTLRAALPACGTGNIRCLNNLCNYSAP